MRVLISTAGSHGDLFPFLIIGQELQARGHEVILYTNSYFQDYVAAAGIKLSPNEKPKTTLCRFTLYRSST